MTHIVPADQLIDFVGKDIGSSDWFEVDQDRIDQFADVTQDHQFIHVDSEKATPLFGSTIAHGFLSLSLIPHLTSQAVLAPENLKHVFSVFKFLRFPTFWNMITYYAFVLVFCNIDVICKGCMEPSIQVTRG